jgi:hypothetical protein
MLPVADRCTSRVTSDRVLIDCHAGTGARHSCLLSTFFMRLYTDDTTANTLQGCAQSI